MTDMLRAFWRLGILLVLLTGCSPTGANEPRLAEGGGTVTYKGAPLANAVVTFIPKDGPLAMGKTDLSGKFKLATSGTPGVAIGPASVTVEIPSAEGGDDIPRFEKTDDPEARKKMQEAMMKRMTSGAPDPSKSTSFIPKRYSKQSESNLKFTVSMKAAENDFKIELTD